MRLLPMKQPWLMTISKAIPIFHLHLQKVIYGSRNRFHPHAS